jgi:DNA-binding Xre family transcriptional regulator
MTVTLTIKARAEKNGIRTAYQLQKLTGLSPSNASKLFNGRSTMISLQTLARLCAGLSCAPSDLLSVRTDADHDPSEVGR